jgi:F-type H+-transporting ATPase subunit epsilon
VHGGFFSVDSDDVAILAESAELGGEIDVVRAQEALDRARAAGADTPDEQAAIARAETRLKVALAEQHKAHGADTSGGHRAGG